MTSDMIDDCVTSDEVAMTNVRSDEVSMLSCEGQWCNK